MDETQGYVQLDVPMPEDMVDYLVALSAKFNVQGDQLDGFSRIVQAMVGVLIECDIDMSGCSGEEELLEKIKHAVTKRVADTKQ